MRRLPTDGCVVVFDLEWTSWPGFRETGFKAPGRFPEVIQIGAVLLDAADDFAELDAFECYVRPRINPELSTYITDLTGITQAQIEKHGLSFGAALIEFFKFAEPTKHLMAYGRDPDVLRLNSDLNNLGPLPDRFEEWDLRRFFGDAGLVGPKSESGSLPLAFGLPPNTANHTGLGDARALASVLRHLRGKGDI